jgi:tungstate transport system substrate-binding protein
VVGPTRHLIRLAVAALVAAVVACAADSERKFLDVATTTSLKNSGLLDAILPLFTRESGLRVRMHAAGSGRALKMMSDGLVDAALSHAPAAEARYLTRHPEWVYQKFAYNRFVVVGPPEDTAGVRRTRDAADAFRRIASARVPFISRGDGSGTHEREQELWHLAEATPTPLLISGPSMAIALRHAHDRGAYTLSDAATFWQMESQVDIVILLDADPRLVNSYAVVHPRANLEAGHFSRWLSHGSGRVAIDAYRIDGRSVFHVWPHACPGSSPKESLCAAR